MRVSVRSRNTERGKVPCVLCLGQSQLRVTAIVERHDVGESHCFEVRVRDGRTFALRHHTQSDAWELAAVYEPHARRHAPVQQPTPAQTPAPARRLAADHGRTKFFERCGKAIAALAHGWKPEPTDTAPAAPA